MVGNISTSPRQADEKTTTLSGNTLKVKGAVDSVTGGEILYLDSSGNISQLDAGTSGQFLKTNGDGSAPSWATAEGLVLLESGSFTNSANLNIDTSGYVASYDKVVLYIECLHASSSTNTTLNMQFNGVTGTTKYNSVGEDFSSGSPGAPVNVDIASDKFQLTASLATTRGISGKMEIDLPAILNNRHGINCNLVCQNFENTLRRMLHGWFESANDISSIKLYASAGNITGRYALYGLSYGI